ncbi:energy-coupling factor ABC transporter permease [Treponema sp. R80B11-R83G3]
MADSLLSPVVGTAMCAVSAAAIGYSVSKIKKDDLCEKKIPIIGVMGAFVFAAQMINFTIPATGSSGHIGGGILLAAMIGSFPALLSLSAVLIIQCLFFADGGLLALGCNIFNMGVIPCLIVYPLLFKPLLKKDITIGRITAASIIAVVVALQLGAFSVVLETLFSGITELPFSSFVLLMLPIHLAIGIVEGIVTAAVLFFVYKMRPEIMESTYNRTAIQSGIPIRKVLVTLAIITALVGGVFAIFASSHPDGLEWSIEKITGTTELESEYKAMEGAASIQEKTAFLPDYNFSDAGEEGTAAGTTLSGILGGILTFLLAGITVFIISIVKKRRSEKQDIRTVRA